MHILCVGFVSGSETIEIYSIRIVIVFRRRHAFFLNRNTHIKGTLTIITLGHINLGVIIDYEMRSLEELWRLESLHAEPRCYEDDAFL